MVTITVCGAKGGITKTTTSVNISSYLASKKKKVLFLDVDPQADATTILLKLRIGENQNIKPPTMFNVLYDFIMKKKNIIQDAIIPVNSYLSLVPSHLDMETFKDVVKSKSRKPIEVFKTLIKGLDDYDYVIIDCPPDMGVYTENAIEASDYILCPSTYDVLGIGALTTMIPTILEICGEDFESYKVLYTKFNKRATRVQKNLGGYSENLENMGKVFDTKIPTDQNIINAQSVQRDFMTEYNSSRARNPYQKIGNYIIKNWR